MAEKEYIEREAIINKINELLSEYEDCDGIFLPKHLIPSGLCKALIFIKTQPTADVQEIVRCKDCKKFCPYLSFCDDNCIDAFGNCQITHMNVSPDFYCGHGEKRIRSEQE